MGIGASGTALSLRSDERRRLRLCRTLLGHPHSPLPREFRRGIDRAGKAAFSFTISPPMISKWNVAGRSLTVNERILAGRRLVAGQ
jgi:hypothetical protein